jgi:hypothetical protein
VLHALVRYAVCQLVIVLGSVSRWLYRVHANMLEQDHPYRVFVDGKAAAFAGDHDAAWLRRVVRPMPTGKEPPSGHRVRQRLVTAAAFAATLMLAAPLS